MSAAVGGSGSDSAGGAPVAGPVEFGGKTYKPLADGRYDAIILGTGLKECILSGLLSVRGKKVLVVDRNGYYGGDCASLNLTNLYRKFIKDEDPPKEFFDALGSNRDFNVDLIPKFIMAGGDLVRLLVKTEITHYLDFKLIDGCYVYKRGAGIFKVPATLEEARSTSLLSLMQKNWLRQLLQSIEKYKKDDPKSWTGGLDWTKKTCKELFDYQWFDRDTGDFVGHAMALEDNDDYLSRPAYETMMAVKLYGESLARHGKSPFIYPVYGLGGLPESFSRKCAIHEGVFMLNTPVDEILYNADGTVAGIRSKVGEDAEVALAPMIIGDPSYFDDSKKRKTGQIIRSICILDHPVKGLEDPSSGMIMIPASQVGRKNDIYVTITGHSHQTTGKGKWVAIVSTTVETKDPKAEVAPGIALLDSHITCFHNISDTFVPADDGTKTKCFVTASYDASSHFEKTTEEVLDLHKRIFGEEFDLSTPADTDVS